MNAVTKRFLQRFLDAVYVHCCGDSYLPSYTTKRNLANAALDLSKALDEDKTIGGEEVTENGK